MLRHATLQITIAIFAAAGAVSGQAPPMVLSTPAFPDGGVIPNRHTQVQQAERGISPQLVWVNAPAATQSFVVHMRDPEVARNRTTDDQVHWLVWNVPATEKGLPEGMPAASSFVLETPSAVHAARSASSANVKAAAIAQRSAAGRPRSKNETYDFRISQPWS
jgi:phosphatidylethanolamine-binding protein (PEBP) family uncharacterized protein